ncbi:MAG: class C sortase [Lachnospiraceae bacterium]
MSCYIPPSATGWNRQNSAGRSQPIRKHRRRWSKKSGLPCWQKPTGIIKSWQSLASASICWERVEKEALLIDGKSYDELLLAEDSGVMGYLEIEKIKLKLPIYHGVSEEALESGVGHLEGTSLPVGGETTHAILFGHRGLPSAKLFTDLDQLEVGDTFQITVLDRVLVYEVTQTEVVLPEELNGLTAESDKDQVTLVTCTPYGVNSHRLLIHGERVQ